MTNPAHTPRRSWKAQQLDVIRERLREDEELSFVADLSDDGLDALRKAVRNLLD